MHKNHSAVDGGEIEILMSPRSELKERCNCNGHCEVHKDGDAGNLKKKYVFAATILVSLLIISLAINIYLGVMSGMCKSSSDSCPSEWIENEGKCYYFSETEGNWTFSQSNCSAYGASLVTIENQKEMNFIMRSKKQTDYWIGLKREKGQPWKWANGTNFND
ncbi:hypothetical protein JD844_013397 [Phrynosoma platyrhinos]|uniref:C-type lectin domain-containing protein n=1 Tax=Phrynosoma platyrhinos TaxID=52577 RepID=A0ABQ7TLY0_PHRPL|nr:hypothetical protein JD844_013397 [Phrynosoma platyrhinos]